MIETNVVITDRWKDAVRARKVFARRTSYWT